MRVQVRHTPRARTRPARFAPPTDELLATSDVVTLHCRSRRDPEPARRRRARVHEARRAARQHRARRADRHARAALGSRERSARGFAADVLDVEPRRPRCAAPPRTAAHPARRFADGRELPAAVPLHAENVVASAGEAPERAACSAAPEPFRSGASRRVRSSRSRGTDRSTGSEVVGDVQLTIVVPSGEEAARGRRHTTRGRIQVVESGDREAHDLAVAPNGAIACTDGGQEISEASESGNRQRARKLSPESGTLPKPRHVERGPCRRRTPSGRRRRRDRRRIQLCRCEQ